jgi:hypothetical protein
LDLTTKRQSKLYRVVVYIAIAGPKLQHAVSPLLSRVSVTCRRPRFINYLLFLASRRLYKSRPAVPAAAAAAAAREAASCIREPVAASCQSSVSRVVLLFRPSDQPHSFLPSPVQPIFVQSPATEPLRLSWPTHPQHLSNF